MSYLDTNKYCFCGTGKKLKFCCKDIVADLEKIVKMLRGKQFVAARETIDRALEAHPDRASLWSLKVEVLGLDNRADEQRQCAEQFARIAPNNPIALCYAAKYRLQDLAEADLEQAEPDWIEDELRQSCQWMHQALANSSEGVTSPMVPKTLSILADMLRNFGYILPAIEHLKLLYMMNQSEDNFDRLGQLLSNPELPLAEKIPLELPKRVDWVEWKDDYQRALKLFYLGGITTAVELVESLLDRHETHPVLLRARAAMRCLLPNPELTRAACRDVIENVDVPLEAAVEAGALLAALTPRSENTSFLAKVSFEVHDVARVLEALQASRRIVLSTEFRPPVKAAFQLLDREDTATEEAVTMDNLPRVRAEGVLFGKETDRDARLEFIVRREDLEDVKGVIVQMCQPHLAHASEEPAANDGFDEILGTPMLPEHASPEVKAAAVCETIKSAFVDRWCLRPHELLDDKTPLEASQDRKYRRPLAGLLQSICHHWLTSPESPDEAFIYEHLHLPAPTTRKLKPGEVAKLPLTQMMFVDADSLSDDDLATAALRSMDVGLRKLVLRFGRLLEARPTSSECSKLPLVLTMMAHAETNHAQAYAYLGKARELAEGREIPVGYFLVEQLRHAIAMGDSELRNSVFDELKRDGHLEDPEVQQMLAQLMQRLRRTGLVESETPADVGGASGQEEAVAASGSLWTPDTASVPADAELGANKPGIWLPGMD